MVLRELPAVARTCAEAAASGSLGLVPTMGALHEGHLSLVRRARAACDVVAVSIFVNPLQFGPGEDLSGYPRREAEDAALLEDAGADLVLILDEEQMYPPGFSTSVVQAGRHVETLEGERRPGHFAGVLTVVTKLFVLVRPARAYFGRKDYQQTLVVRRLVEDLGLPVAIEVCGTVREPDGLAMSSRNAYLDAAQRRRARCLVDALAEAQRRFTAGETDAGRLASALHATLAGGLDGPPDYACVVDPDTLAPRAVALAGDVALVAGRVGPARLIDNHVLGTPLGPFAR